jgi:hypothetical protein
MPRRKDLQFLSLNAGVNLRGLTGGQNFRPGQAQDAVDVLPREDGGIFKHHGWLRKNAGALSGRIVAIKTFTYKGKNAGSGSGYTRFGNWGIADDAAPQDQFTRRLDFFTGCIVLTTTNGYCWDPTAETFLNLPIPGTWSILTEPKPVCIPIKNNVYIANWIQNPVHNTGSSVVVRFDPTDVYRNTPGAPQTVGAWYAAGWDGLPHQFDNTKITTLSTVDGDLIEGATYKYAAAYFDVYTGEESPQWPWNNKTYPQVVKSVTIPVGHNTVRFATGAFTDWPGVNRWYDDGSGGPADPEDTDVGVVLYRTGPDQETYYFLEDFTPPLSTMADWDDDGLVTEKSKEMQTHAGTPGPPVNTFNFFKGQFYATSWADEDPSKLYYNRYIGYHSYIENWDRSDFEILPLKQGDTPLAISNTDNYLLILSKKGGYLGSINATSGGRISRKFNPLPWTTGAVGPKAVCQANGWVYYLSERGPYRWREGLAQPQWIGRDLLPVFVDPSSGLCSLNERSKTLSECLYDQDAGVVRFIFPVGGAKFPNVHLMYWVHDDIPGGPQDPCLGWFFASPKAQAFDYGNGIAPTDPDGNTVSPFNRRDRFIFGTADGYVNEYEIGSRRAGLIEVLPARGEVLAGSTTSLINVNGGLYTDGDAMAGMRLEIEYADGSYDVRTVASNTLTTITPSHALSQSPVGATWYVAGVPAFWRQIPEHYGLPFNEKSGVEMGIKMLAQGAKGIVGRVDVSTLVGEFPEGYDTTEQMKTDVHHDKYVNSASGKHVMLEIANTRPDESFVLTGILSRLISGEVRERDE